MPVFMMKIRSDAKRVFKGIIFDVYQWQQKLFDGSTATFEALKRPNTVQIIAVRKGKAQQICILREQQPTKGPFYSLPGGRQEEGETPLDCAKRELLEETGLASDDWSLLYNFEPLHKMEWFVYTFAARNCKAVAKQKLDAGEKISMRWVSFELFIKIVIGKNFWGREFVVEVLKAKLTRRGIDTLRKKLSGDKYS